MREDHVHNRQAGLGLMALIAILALVAVLALFGMKVIPSFLEFRAARGAIVAIAQEMPNAAPNEIRRAFENRSNIDDINSIKPSDLDIGKDGNQITIGFAYRKEIPLFKHVGLYIDYTASAGGE